MCAIFRIPPGVDLWNVNMDTVAHRYVPWQNILPIFNYDKKTPFFEMLVPTVDTVRFGYIMERLIYVNSPVFITGDTGRDKILIILISSLNK